MSRPRDLTDGTEDARRRMVFCLCADLTRSGEWLSALPSFKSTRFNVFFAQLLEMYYSALEVSRRAKYEGDAWLVATDNVEEVIALCFLALDLRRTFQRRAAEVLQIAAESVPPLHLTICSGADVPVAPVSGHDWAGDSFRRAVRMSSQSCEGSILIDTPVYYLVRQDFTTKYLTAVAVKSKKRVTEETIALYELLDVQDSVVAVQEAPGIYIRGLRVLGCTDLADELTQRTTARLQERTLETPVPDRGGLLPAWNNLLASVSEYDMMLPLFEALVHAKLAPDLTTYSMLIGRAPDYATAKDWFDRMEREGVGPDSSIYQTLLARAPDRLTAKYWLERAEEKVVEFAGSPRDNLSHPAPEQHVPAEEQFEETAKPGTATETSGSAVSVMIHTGHGQGAGGAGVILNKHPLLILTASHVLAGIEASSTASLAIDGAAHRLRRVTPLPEANLLSILATKGRVGRDKRGVELPHHAVVLSEAQAVTLELERGGVFTTSPGEVTRVMREGEEKTVLLNIAIAQGDSGAPMFVNGRLAGLCQAKSGSGPTGPAVVSPLRQDSLVRLRRLARGARVLRYGVRVGISLSIIVALFVLVWSQFPSGGRNGCEPRPAVSAWLDKDKTYYNVGEPIVLHYRINKQCNVSLKEQIENAPQTTMLDRLLRTPGDHEFRATASDVTGNRTLRVTVADACGVTAESVVLFQVGRLRLAPVGPSTTLSSARFSDANLEQAVRKTLGRTSGEILDSDLTALTQLSARDSQIRDLTGLEQCVALRSLNVGSNQIADLHPLAALANLRELWIDCNPQITDITPLRGLTSLVRLDLTKDQVSDLSALARLVSLEMLFIGGNPIKAGGLAPLSNLTRLKVLHAWGCELTSISGLAGLTSVRELDLETNKIADIGPLRSLANLSSLRLHDNQITRIEALEENSGLGLGDDIYLQNNYLGLSPGSDALRIILALRSRGADVTYEPQLTP